MNIRLRGAKDVSAGIETRSSAIEPNIPAIRALPPSAPDLGLDLDRDRHRRPRPYNGFAESLTKRIHHNILLMRCPYG